ncbi:hydrogenase maturation protease [Amycolatopsis mongoliensis]|uniref:Hydrogenase maturation protease n=1 Tax=Amycolatopsis mongoliensis TaxID=715475 RepID=A0A9Y2JKP4_9PSEU|nr:hydrogenase maturation protease [Amycolatopsis sp. 4-36]WIY00401.1 hydrogenase maturation protease [Amycolatopsis sp. 4-36]
MTDVVIGLGNPLCGDDGIGPAVVAALPALPGVRVVGRIADPLALVDAWTGAGLAVVVDAVRGAFPAGEVVRCTGADGLPAGAGRGGHTLDVAAAARLGQALGRSPRRLVVLGVAGVDFTPGRGLSAPVAAAVPAAVRAVLAEGLWSSQIGQNARSAVRPEGVG